jgi:hypothetical protein
MPESVSPAVAFLRFQFPRNPCKARYDRRAAEADARKVAAYWLEKWQSVPEEKRTPGWLQQAIRDLAVQCRVECVEEPELPGHEHLALWLSFVRAPGRVFLQVSSGRCGRTEQPPAYYTQPPSSHRTDSYPSRRAQVRRPRSCGLCLHRAMDAFGQRVWDLRRTGEILNVSMAQAPERPVLIDRCRYVLRTYPSHPQSQSPLPGPTVFLSPLPLGEQMAG